MFSHSIKWHKDLINNFWVLKWIIFQRVRETIDCKLRDEHAGFGQCRSCVDQIFTLGTIIEQEVEWNSPLFVNLIDFVKAFDSIDLNTLWSILGYYGMPKRLVNLIRCQYDGSSCRVIHGGGLSEAFEVCRSHTFDNGWANQPKPHVCDSRYPENHPCKDHVSSQIWPL